MTARAQLATACGKTGRPAAILAQPKTNGETYARVLRWIRKRLPVMRRHEGTTHMRRILASLLLLVLAACAGTRETPLSDAQLGALVQGQTTRTQAAALLGKPAEIRSNREGMQMVYSWRPNQTNTFNNLPGAGISSAAVEVQRREIVLSFDGGEVLRDIARTDHTLRNGAMNVAPQPGG